MTPVDRAPSLLRSLGLLADDVALDELTVGQCDARLFELRRAMFGEVLEVVATCPACHTDVELAIGLSEIRPPVKEGTVPPIEVEAGDHVVECRVPRNGDLRALTELGGAATLEDLVARCAARVLDVDGRAVAVTELPDSTLEAIANSMARGDPGAQTALRIRCPCGSEWVEELDIRSFLWRDVTDWVGRTLNDVHMLALSYGWSEAEILGMAAWRRRWYMEAAGW